MLHLSNHMEMEIYLYRMSATVVKLRVVLFI